jgi:pyruvate/2-oxoglutarate dehydrogenase complex dihydrolipoamide dehydrogenase (E3) component
MHQAALYNDDFHDAKNYGWKVPEATTIEHSWEVLRDAIKDYIGSLNWGYRVQLREKNIDYLNVLGELIDPHAIKTTTIDKKTQKVKSSVSELYLMNLF